VGEQIAHVGECDRGAREATQRFLARRDARDSVRAVADREIVSASGAPPAIGPYSHGVLVRSAGLLFCSGQIPLDPAGGELVGDTPPEQARRCLENLQAVCEEAGTTLENAVRLTIYMVDLASFAPVNEVYASFFGEDPPARVTVGVAQLPRGAYVEIDAVVALPEAVVGGSAP
jgi:2-iminobutanoate/2-iminopropanoate deaminase